jgi:hypothetical protein
MVNSIGRKNKQTRISFDNPWGVSETWNYQNRSTKSLKIGKKSSKYNETTLKNCQFR